MLIKQGIPLKDPNRDCNQKHTTPNEIMENTRKSKERRHKTNPNKTFVRYSEGQYEQIFKKTNDK